MMRQFSIFFVFVCLSAAATFAQESESIPTLLEPIEGAAPEEESHRFLWRTDPGIRYSLQESTDLENWTEVSGYPAEADGPVEFHEFASQEAAAKFYQAIRLDEQPPTIANRYPKVDATAVPRFADLQMELVDASEIDPSSILLTVGGQSPVTLADAALSLDGNILTFDSTDLALGTFEESISVSLAVADVLGNEATYAWSFTLEADVLLSESEENIFVFGSPAAQRSGQRISDRQRQLSRAMFGRVPVRANSAGYELTEINADSLVLTLDGLTPAFDVDDVVMNTLPLQASDLFYRRILGISLSPDGTVMTLQTQELTLAEVVQTGSISLNENSRLIDPSGSSALLSPALSVSGDVRFPTIGGTFPWDGEIAIKHKISGTEEDSVTFTASELRAELTPRIGGEAEIRWGDLESASFHIGADVVLKAELGVAIAKSISVEGTIYELPLATRRQLTRIIYFGQLGPVPVFATLEFDFKVTGGVGVTGQSTMTYTLVRTFHPQISFNFPIPPSDNDKPKPSMSKPSSGNMGLTDPDAVVDLALEGSVWVAAKPSIELNVYGLLGVGASIYPKVSFTYSFNDKEDSEEHDGYRDSAILEAKLLAEIYPSGLIAERIDNIAEASLKYEMWSLATDYLAPPGESFSVVIEEDAGREIRWINGKLDRTHNAYLTYDGYRIPGTQTAESLQLPSDYDFTAPLRVVGVFDDGEEVVSEPIALQSAPSALSGFSLIPAGSFEMGDSFNEGSSNERPVHSVSVSAFYMAQTETTYSRWQEVYNWAVSNGYSFDNAGSGKGADHPVHTVSWYDVVKWCNAASEREGLGPVYRTSGGGVYRTGQIAPVIDYGNKGYRLPTEAEWEKAARGGLSGKRFPWGDTISHSEANYRAGGDLYSYDSSPFTDLRYHPSYDDGGTPYTSPVGSFGANGYGLYDMAGNLFEWCNDWYASSYYSSSPGSDPAGPGSGAGRVLRGGSWYYFAGRCRSANRDRYSPDSHTGNRGFRLAHSQ